MIYLVIALVYILSIVTSYYYTKDVSCKRVFFKAFASMGFVLVSIIAYYNSSATFYAKGIIIALSFGMLGDILLSLHPFVSRKSANIFNLLGMLSFIFEHMCYIGVFLHFTAFSYNSVIYYTIIPIIILSLILGKVIVAKDKNIAIIIYSIVISVMFVEGIRFFTETVFQNSLVILIGVILFVISDFVLLMYNFSRYKTKWMMPFILMVYFTAQILFAYSIILIR